MGSITVLMPPGLDGIDTITRLWEVDPDIQIVICTAYAKYSWEEIRAKLGKRDCFFILKKPFDRMEVIQLACALTQRWNIQKLIKHPVVETEYSSDTFGIESTTASIKSQLKDLEAILLKF